MSDQDQEQLDQVLADYLDATDGAPTPGFVDWVVRSVSTEPFPRRGVLASLWLALSLPGPRRSVVQAALIVVILLAGVGSAVAVGEISGLLSDQHVGSSPSPMPSRGPVLTPTPEPSSSPAAPSPSPAETDDQASPGGSDPADSSPAEPGEDLEIPEPSEAS